MTPLLNPVSIGPLNLKNNLALAPMAGITNAAFRILAAEGGAGLVVTEMVSAESIKYGNKKPKMLRLHFAIKRETKKLIVGHFGDHMENYSTRKR